MGIRVGVYSRPDVKNHVDNYQVEVLITLASGDRGGYAFADAFHLSGPIAIVVAGLIIGNQGRFFAMSNSTRSSSRMFSGN